MMMIPKDDSALWIGRVWSNREGGPRVVLVKHHQVYDLTPQYPTVSDLFDLDSLETVLRDWDDNPIGSWEYLIAEDNQNYSLLSPLDLQAIKAAGVTFAVSMLERVIEENAGGDPQKAESLRQELNQAIGNDLRQVEPGSESAQKLKAFLQEKGLWSQYLEVGIGPDAEIFTKGQPMSSVGTGASVGVLSTSHWNNPEPEVVLAINHQGKIVGATLGNDVNLRDYEGRSALLLGKAKDNNASCAIGPLIRIFTAQFTLGDIESEVVNLDIKGKDGFSLSESSDMKNISRTPQKLVNQLIGDHHQYPDGVALFLGTMFAPIQDRDEPGSGFTHHVGDVVTIHSKHLGVLTNTVEHSEKLPPWEYGVRELYKYLFAKNLLGS
ncbi:putative 2-HYDROXYHEPTA-2,4-DIENE-1,7-DIOATE ISOMERASE [Vibrio nigripulchritudo SFn27]|nr:fumarylacetoacetate hydrolase family protein [Vibrio nigripulchritudo]CCN81277.1 putative 2-HYDROXYHEPTA-2,4-DIENE-1,7-DIOATE ISOMERASE [Vibrio nigripulchritudo BLFn1]CCN86600.1 putative 2-HYDROXYHEPTA-2,4-DIENE-1,7-DIOATE ISOMERASE [Vibrio nigripulchritudo SFn27]CCN97153.1 putative 2-HYDROXYHEPTA-2,4-DIENE-1,7-DIOATE ISOMERASE [Vibrio nigripulchritudo ENn2]CCO43014.1 putative 2-HYDROXYHEPTA-2,4-DIENE-1,7-DIOATE ISOMERASE [Vibrio nigripulchritudo SFn135]CCO50650.1 putative 2-HYDROXYHEPTA-2,